MVGIVSMILDGANQHRFPEIVRIAESKDPEAWHKMKNTFQTAFDELLKVDASLAHKLDNAVSEEQCLIESIAYSMGLADGLQLAKLNDPSVDKTELIYE